MTSSDSIQSIHVGDNCSRRYFRKSPYILSTKPFDKIISEIIERYNNDQSMEITFASFLLESSFTNKIIEGLSKRGYIITPSTDETFAILVTRES